jgi:vancomycin resistance protein VanJ
LRFDQLQAGSAGSGARADGLDGEGPIAQGAAAVGASGDDGAQDADDAARISDEAAASAEGSPASAQSAQPVTDHPAPQIHPGDPRTALAVATPVFAISDIIRSAADQATATWKTAAVPPQRRESPATPVRAIDAPTVRVPAALEPAPPAVLDEAPTRINPIVPTAPVVTESLASESAVSESVVSESPASESAAAKSAASAMLTAGLDTGADVAREADADAADGGTGAGAAARADDDTHWPGARRQIAVLTMIVSVLILAVLLGHRYFPDVLGLGSLIDTFLPWTFAPLLLALPAAVLSLKKWTIGVCLLTCAVWTGDFAPTLLRSGGAGPADIRVLSQNVSSGDDSAAHDLSGVARLAEQRGADIVVLQGLSKDVEQADQAAPARYPYHMAMYEFVVWSRFPIGSSQPVDLGGGRPSDASQAGAAAASSSGSFGGLLRFTVNVDQSRQVTVYAVHLPQPSLSHDGFGIARDDALEQLVDHVRTEKSPNLIVLGDLDVAQTDRAMRPLLASSTGLVSAQAKAGSGFGFTWPATFPVVRLDDVLTRGLAPVASVVLPAVGSQQAHRPIEADLKF